MFKIPFDDQNKISHALIKDLELRMSKTLLLPITREWFQQIVIEIFVVGLSLHFNIFRSKYINLEKTL